MPISLEEARRRILAGEHLTLEEHRALFEEWRNRRASVTQKPPKQPAVKIKSLDDLLADFK